MQLSGLSILGHFGLVEWEMMQKRGDWMPELLKELRERETAVQKTSQSTYIRHLKLDSVNTSLGD